MKIGVIGSNGVLGRRLIPLLQSQGHQVRCIVRTRGTTCPAHTEMTYADILDEESLVAALAGLNVVVNLATSIPNGKGKGSWADNDRIRVDGTKHLVNALIRLDGGCRLVQQSVAMLHQSNKLVDETDEVIGQGVLTSAVVMEATVQGAEIDWVLLRGAAVYGPDTARDAEFFGRIASGQLLPPEDPNRWISLIHIDDLVSAFAHVIALPGRRAYIAADDHPTTYMGLFRRFAGLSGQAPCEGTRMVALPSFKVTNQRLRQSGWEPRHPDVFRAMHGSATTIQKEMNHEYLCYQS